MKEFSRLTPQAQETYLRRLRLIVAMLEVRHLSNNDIVLDCSILACPDCQSRGQCCVESPSLLSAH